MTLIVVTFTFDQEKNEFTYFSNTDPMTATQLLHQLSVNMAVQAAAKEDGHAPEPVPAEPES